MSCSGGERGRGRGERSGREKQEGKKHLHGKLSPGPACHPAPVHGRRVRRRGQPPEGVLLETPAKVAQRAHDREGPALLVLLLLLQLQLDERAGGGGAEGDARGEHGAFVRLPWWVACWMDGAGRLVARWYRERKCVCEEKGGVVLFCLRFGRPEL